ncbi:MAG: hypothetical protein P1V36_07240, partial [Planctomycetota bacterium]|nr:hypothetical protein [Planctomycetota bacterium]
MPPDAADEAKDPVLAAYDECFHLRVGHIQQATKRYHAVDAAEAGEPLLVPVAAAAPSEPAPPEADAAAADPRGDMPVETVPDVDGIQVRQQEFDSIIDYSYKPPESELVNTGGL